MIEDLLKSVERDCLSHGRGRKKWWADRLSISPLTLSHWLARRQWPNGDRALKVAEILEEVSRGRATSVWLSYLWKVYYRPGSLTYDPDVLKIVIPECLQVSRLDSRSLALLSHLVEREGLSFDKPLSPKLANRVGWLLEISGKKAAFPVDKHVGVQTFLSISVYREEWKTPYGRKWMIRDCNISALKDSLL